jgi:imidazolonepropionase-like amidohydrolase
MTMPAPPEAAAPPPLRVRARRVVERLASAASRGAALSAALAAGFPMLAHAQAGAPNESAAAVPPRGIYAFTNVNVVPMDTERVLPGQTVLVEQGRITAIGPTASMSVPAEATDIDGSGRYLMPGLGEMHAHVPTTRAEGEEYAFLYLAGGATTIRGMLGDPSQLELRRRIESGEIVGPRMWLAAPALRGTNVPDTATAERLVRAAKAEGYDLLKIQEGLSAEVYRAIAATAEAVGIPFGGHVPDEVGVPGALAAGQSTIDHLDNYIDALQRAGSPALGATGAERQRLLPLYVDEDKIEALARATLEAGVAVVPTQMLWETLRGAREPSTLTARPENRYVPQSLRREWRNRANDIYSSASRLSAQREAEVRQALLKSMSDEGVMILLGTDAPQVFSVPGFSLHRELPLMVESGMTPYEVLRTGTVNVAKYLGNEARAGTVAVGNNADLLLLAANPLTEIRAFERTVGVMIDGRWLSHEAISARLARIAAKYNQ